MSLTPASRRWWALATPLGRSLPVPISREEVGTAAVKAIGRLGPLAAIAAYRGSLFQPGTRRLDWGSASRISNERRGVGLLLNSTLPA
jgi:hypothetical protein